jgi:hypothetical protein
MGFSARRTGRVRDEFFLLEVSSMEQKENLKKGIEDKLADLFEQANRDPALKRDLLRDPRAVAEKFGVKFNDDEVQQLQKLGALSELTEEIKFGRLYPRPPIFYPIHIWQIKELLEIFSRLIPGDIVTYPGPGPIFYPAWDFGQKPVFTTRAFRPGWVNYPGDDQGGSGSTWKGGVVYGGGVIPGPIFYPASLRNLLKERLLQILQVSQQLNR